MKFRKNVNVEFTNFKKDKNDGKTCDFYEKMSDHRSQKSLSKFFIRMHALTS